jgi:hypothetical protein
MLPRRSISQFLPTHSRAEPHLLTQVIGMLYLSLRLSELLAHRLRLVASIMTEPRSAPQYFYVAYYGKSFPTALLSHRFVYRGSDWEKVSGFSDRLLSKRTSITTTVLPL